MGSIMTEEENKQKALHQVTKLAGKLDRKNITFGDFLRQVSLELDKVWEVAKKEGKRELAQQELAILEGFSERPTISHEVEIAEIVDFLNKALEPELVGCTVDGDTLQKVFGKLIKQKALEDRLMLWEFEKHEVTTVMVGAGLWEVVGIREIPELETRE